MSALAASNNFSSSDSISQSPPKPSSPTTISSPPFANQHTTRSFMNLNHSVDFRAQHPIFPATPPLFQQPASLDLPPSITYFDFLKTWTDSHVARWLADFKCGMHAETFKANDIRGDVLLELDQIALKEMNISSIGDRLRILNAVKILRQRAASRSPVATSSTRAPLGSESRSPSESSKTDSTSTTSRLVPRREPSRPPPLLLNPNANKGDLPDIMREPPPDSARSIFAHNIRPLPQPTQSTLTPPNAQNGTPGSAQLTTPGLLRPHLPPLPPPPRGQPPPPPPSNRTPVRPWATPTQEAPAYTSQPLPPPPQNQGHLTPSSNNWANQHLPSDPRPGNPGSAKPAIPRSTSPLPPPRVRNGIVASTPGKLLNSPNNSPVGKTASRVGNSSHPYASAQPSLHPPNNYQNHNLSPIEEAFSTQHSSAGTPSPPSLAYTVGRGPFNPAASLQGGHYSLDDLRKKLVKFVIPDEGTSFTIDVANCASGYEVIEKVLKKIGKGNTRSQDSEGNPDRDDDDYLCVDGWVVYQDPPDDGTGEPLTELQLLSICHAPDHPAREYGLTVRRLRRAEDRSPSPLSMQNKALIQSQTSKALKRASTISILSGLGVQDPENVLDPPSPTSSTMNSPWPSTKRPSKLRNFFGQRPPSELITDHLPEFFPFTEKKVLRTARHSMLMRSGTLSAKRQSVASFSQPLPSRFSSSTQGSQGRRSISPSRASLSSIPPPPVPDKNEQTTEPIPRMSLSTEDGQSVDLHSDDGGPSVSTLPQLLPPIPLGTGSFSDSMEEITGPQSSRPVSRAMSINSKRMSFMSELRSKRDRSDTASMMTVDEITAEVESRRVSKVPDMANPDLDDWTKVDNDEATGTVLDEDDSVLDEEEEETLDVDDDENTLNEDDDPDDFGIAIPTRTANKWIKGALIGAGSFGKVYLGMDASNGLLMAVKQVELPTGSGPNQERKKSMLSALEREIELLKNLQHENIVQYLYSSIDDEYLNIFLEYVPGGSVTALLQNYGAFEEPLVKNFVRQILQGLDYLHERDIIHRDIKGANILVDNKGGIKISDFGISKKVDDNLLTGNRLHRPSLQGSVFWMAPEVVKQTGHTRKADIWSVGCLVVEMLTGEHPWAQLTQMQAIFKIGSSARPTIPTDISIEAQNFLQRTFEINHEARPSAAELLQHLWIAIKPVPTPKAKSNSPAEITS